MARPRKQDGKVFARKGTTMLWMRYPDRDGKTQRESAETSNWDEAHRRLRERLGDRDSNVLSVIRKGQSLQFGEWADTFLETFSKPPLRAPKTHEANLRAVKHLRPVFGEHKLPELTSEAIEAYLRERLKQRVRVATSGGVVEHGLVKPATVHQEYRILQRMLNVAVRKKLISANPVPVLSSRSDSKACSGRTTWLGLSSNKSKPTPRLTCVILFASLRKPASVSTKN